MTRQFMDDQAWVHRANQAINHANEATKPRSGWRPPYWFQGEPGEDIRFFKGNYGGQPIQINYQVWIPNAADPASQRRRERGKNPGKHIPCNCNAGQLPVACVPCHIIAESKKKGERSPFFVSNAQAINLVVLKTFHKTKVTGQNGKEYTRYERCTADLGSCKYCEQNDETFFGNTTYANLFNKEWHQIMAMQRQIAFKCQSCDSGVVVPTAAKCPRCARIYEYPIGQLSKMESEEKVFCESCGFEGAFFYAKECRIYDRTSGDYAPGCNDAKTLGIFDVNMRIQKRKTSETRGRDGKMRRQYQMEMTNWDTDPLTDELKKKLTYQTDFGFLMNMPTEEQAMTMGVDNPFKGVRSDDRFGLPEVQAGDQGAGFKAGTGVPNPLMSDAPVQEPAAQPAQAPAPQPVPQSQPMAPPPTGAAPIPQSQPAPPVSAPRQTDHVAPDGNDAITDVSGGGDDDDGSWPF